MDTAAETWAGTMGTLCALCRLRPHPQPRLEQQVAFELHICGRSCPTPNPFKANYNTVTVIAFPSMTTQGPACLSLPRLYFSLCPVWLLSPLAAAAAIDTITVLATEGRT